MANTATGSVLGATWSGTTWSYSSVKASYAGYDSSSHRVTFIQFQTPVFTGVSVEASFGIYAYKGVGNTCNLRYAICTSDENHDLYKSTTSAVDDPYQITSGTVSLGTMTSSTVLKTIDISTADLEPDTTYYLALWSCENTGISIQGVSSGYGTFSMELTYNVTYTVTYKANGHGTAPSAQTVIEDDSITLPTMTATGYNFLGWSTSSTATSGMTGSYTVTDDVTLYAVWKQAGSYVYYNDNGTAVKCEVYYNDNGNAVRCDVYFNDDGTAVKM